MPHGMGSRLSLQIIQLTMAQILALIHSVKYRCNRQASQDMLLLVKHSNRVYTEGWRQNAHYEQTMSRTQESLAAMKLLAHNCLPLTESGDCYGLMGQNRAQTTQGMAPWQ